MFRRSAAAEAGKAAVVVGAVGAVGIALVLVVREALSVDPLAGARQAAGDAVRVVVDVLDQAARAVGDPVFGTTRANPGYVDTGDPSTSVWGPGLKREPGAAGEAYNWLSGLRHQRNVGLDQRAVVLPLEDHVSRIVLGVTLTQPGDLFGPQPTRLSDRQLAEVGVRRNRETGLFEPIPGAEVQGIYEERSTDPSVPGSVNYDPFRDPHNPLYGREAEFWGGA